MNSGDYGMEDEQDYIGGVCFDLGDRRRLCVGRIEPDSRNLMWFLNVLLVVSCVVQIR